MRGSLGSLRIFFIIFLSGFGSSDVETTLISSEPTTQNPRSSAIHKGYSIYSAQNVAYKINYEHMTWAEARNRCISDGGDLAIADTNDKIQYIRSIPSGSQNNWLYVGIYRPVGYQKWIRVDDDLPAKLLPWISSPSVHSGHNCAATTHGFQLTDINCKWKQQSVCQISFHEDPVTMDSGFTSEDLNEKITITTTTTTTMTTTNEKLFSSSSVSSYTPYGWENTILSVLFLTSVLVA